MLNNTCTPWWTKDEERKLHSDLFGFQHKRGGKWHSGAIGSGAIGSVDPAADRSKVVTRLGDS